jgi:serine/threonine-protein kinase
LYLDDLSPDHRLSYVTDGLTEAMIGALDQVPALKVISQGGVAAWRDPAVPRDSVARALDAGTLVQGSVEPVGDKLRVQLRLVDGNSGVDLAGRRASFDLPAAELLKVRDSLATEAADLIRQRLGEEVRLRREREGTGNVAAWSLVQRARELRRQGEAAAQTGNETAFLTSFHQADSLAEAAVALDPRWTDPLVLRGLLSYRRAYLLGQNDPQAAASWIDSGLAQIARSYTIQPNNPDALEIRGNLRYWRWLLQLERDDGKARVLLKDAQTDLEQATRVNPTQAGAWASLSHLYNQTGSGVDVSLAARRALEADAFLDNADKVFGRLFTASYDLGQFPDADHWCNEAVHRFPADPRLLKCRLFMLTTKQVPPDVPLAWRLADSVLAMTAEQERPYWQLYYRTLVAAVLGRAGLVDSASRVLKSAAGNPQVDPQGDLALVGAFAALQMGNKKEALAQLKAYFAASPGRVDAFKDDVGWWFRDLQGDPGFKQLVGGK